MRSKFHEVELQSVALLSQRFLKEHRAKPAPEMERSGIEGGMAGEWSGL